MQVKTCLHCGDEFERNPNYSRKQWETARFCSRGCSTRWRAGHEPRGAATSPCSSCGEQTRGLVRGFCKPCYHRERYKAKREHILTVNRAWRERNPEYYKQEHLLERAKRRSMQEYHGDVELHAAVLERDDYTCQMCFVKAPNRRGADGVCVHHIDADRFNRDPCNLIVLCNSCHARLHARHGHYFGHKEAA